MNILFVFSNIIDVEPINATEIDGTQMGSTYMTPHFVGSISGMS